MTFTLVFTHVADEQKKELEQDKAKETVLKAVRKCLGYLQSNPRHPGLNSHQYSSMEGAGGEKIFESYAQNQTPGAYRVFWHYGPNKNALTIIAITPHP